MPTKLVIFDLDNTLVITQPAAKIAYKRAIEFIAKKHGIEKNSNKLYAHWKKMVQTLKNDSDPAKRRFNYSLSLLLKHHKIPETYFPQAINTYTKTLIENLTSNKGAKDLLTYLKSIKYKIAVATGSDRFEARKKLKASKLWDLIDTLVTPNETGIMKPHESFYTTILQKFHLNPSQVVVVGDSKKDDLLPAQKLGIKVILYTPNTHLNTLKSQI